MRDTSRAWTGRGTFVSARTRCARALSIIAILLGASGARAKEYVRAPVLLDLTYFRCVAPTGLERSTFSRQDRARFPECREWETVNIHRKVFVNFNDEAYVFHKNDEPSGNAFVRDVVTSSYDLPQAAATALTPSQLESLHDTPERFGWIRLPHPIAGALAVIKSASGTFAGLLLGNLPDSLVLHPSGHRHGLLHPTSLRALTSGNDSVYVLPKKLAKALTTVGWNVWADPDQAPPFHPAPHLHPNTQYNITLHLSGIGYDDVTEATPRKTMLEWLRSSVSARTARQDLTVFMLPDETYVHPELPTNTQPLTVDIDRVRAWAEHGSSDRRTPMQQLRAKGDAPFVFGRTQFIVRTRARHGQTFIGFSIWDATGRPLEEIVMPICVATDEDARSMCAGVPLVTQSFSGFDSGLLAAPPAESPIAALHFLDLGAQGVVGVLRTAASTEPMAWHLNTTTDELTNRISAALNSGGIGDDANLAPVGEQLYAMLFCRTDPANEQATSVRATFETALRNGRRTDGEMPPAVFVRMLANVSWRRELLLPLGLVYVSALGPTAVPPFLGFHYRMEMPLRQQTVTEHPCINHWVLLLPAADSNLGDTRRAIIAAAPRWCAPGTFYESFQDLRTRWLDREVEDDTPVALLITSHHVSDRGVGQLYVEPGDYMTADKVQRRFTQPSIAILNGCGSGENADDFVGALNAHGFEAVIATTRTVATDVAEAYVACLASTLQDETTPQPLAAVHFRTLECLRGATYHNGDEIGARALAYALYGNGGLCVRAP